MNPDKKNTIDLATAQEWTAAWRAKHPNCSKAFLVPAVDLVEVLNEIGVLSDKAAKKAQAKAEKKGLKTRAYLAIGADPGETVEDKLIFVGTKRDKEGVYRDLINGMVDGKTVSSDLINSSGIYDFTSPCPPVCDEQSPINHIQ